MESKGKNFLVALVGSLYDGDSFTLNIFDSKEEAMAYAQEAAKRIKLQGDQVIVVVRTDETEYKLPGVKYYYYKGWGSEEQK